MTRDKDEDYMPVRDVAKFVEEQTGVHVVIASVYNWLRGQATDYAGKPLRMRSTRRMGRMYTTKRWVMDFCERK